MCSKCHDPDARIRGIHPALELLVAVLGGALLSATILLALASTVGVGP